MLNQITVEGFVTNKSWKYGGDTFFRLASYRDQDLPTKPRNGRGNRDAADYFTVRIPTSQSSMPVSVTPRQRLRVHGFLQSRDYLESLADFLKDARGDGIGRVRARMRVPDDVEPGELAAPRSLTEIVAGRIIVLDAPQKRAERNVEKD